MMSRFVVCAAAMVLLAIQCANAAPPYPISVLQALDASVRAACPQIDGVSVDGSIFFQPNATCQTAANAAMQNFIPPASNVYLQSSVLLGRLTDAEYTAIMQVAASQLASGNGQLSRWIDMARTQPIGLSDPPTIAAKTNLVAAGLLTKTRADAIFAPP